MAFGCPVSENGPADRPRDGAGGQTQLSCGSVRGIDRTRVGAPAAAMAFGCPVSGNGLLIGRAMALVAGGS